MTVKLIRMWSGEDVIADITKEDTDSITITDPIVAVPSQKQGQIAFAPWSPLLQKDKLEVTKNMLFILEILKMKLSNSIIQCLVNYLHQLRNLYYELLAL